MLGRAAQVEQITNEVQPTDNWCLRDTAQITPREATQYASIDL